MTDVHERDHQVEAAIKVKEVADQTCPALALRLGATREAIPRKVNEMHAVSLKEVDIACLSRRARHLDQALSAKQLVHN